ncbi:cytochrome oxidase subunit III [Mangrovimonas yunxiaonensis]|uniref:Cytochrome oxidase subunit III n=1 Tax=Mangrovimonas yunxiaonensis TaxID=1197477 RepID=A0A084TMD7_9FLAO|nr:cytochrome c oxidase subunit 3 [Mangrovimonas yunxiaonensis]KFB01873.1 cytochrome oxidase subunit III [Mangrovimonas yunxiaonensis]MBR9758595.1 heme-copper oxidase subunit III [Algicola sp.]GGH44422.1 cytochrome oxidase subunit III [Mangrovimonas yunxiaonensis]
MDLTQGTNEEKNIRAKKMMLWFGIISLTMSFAGLTSAVVVSSSRPDWLTDFALPKAFITSTVIIILSSITFFMAKRAVKQGKRPMATTLLLATLALGLAFVFMQFVGFGQIIDLGYRFTGPTSNVTMSFVYIIAFVHILHLLVGLISISIVIYNHFKQKYSASNMLGIDLSATYWHFVDILWLFLFLFLNYLS